MFSVSGSQAGTLVLKLKAEPVDLLQACCPQLYLLLLSVSLSLLWETAMFGRERTLSLCTFPSLRCHLCFGGDEGASIVWEKEMLFWGSGNFGVPFPQLLPRLFLLSVISPLPLGGLVLALGGTGLMQTPE